MESKRYYVLDNIRGITLISMILYHAVWDIVYIYDVSWGWFRSDLAYVWQQSICWTFILLSGFCWSFGRHKLRRGILVFGAGLLVSLVTVFVVPDSLIIYGVLTFLGTSMLLMLLLEPLCKKGNPVLGCMIVIILFVLFRNVNDGNIGFEAVEVMSLPDDLYANMATTFLGFPVRGFFSTDYFSLVPWFFLFQTGYFINRVLEEKKGMKYLTGKKIPVLGWMGRNSLWIYMLHQPIVYGILCIWLEL